MTVSLKTEILERLDLKKGKRNLRANSQKPASRALRNESAKPKKGDKLIYEGKTVIFESYNPQSGMAVINRGKNSQVIVRASDLSYNQLTEGVLGMSSVAPTWVEPRAATVKLEMLDPEDIGLVFEDDDTGEKDDQEEDDDNGSNVRHDGHSGKTQVDTIPTPSDTIATAYTDEKPPKEMGQPLSTEPGYTVATDPDFDGYDYPADAPDIPKPDFQGAEAGNARAPDFGGGHDGGDGQEDRDDYDVHHSDRTNEAFEPEEEDDEEGEEEEKFPFKKGKKKTDESYLGFDKLENRLKHKSGIRNPGAVAASIGRKKYGKKKFQAAAAQHHLMESFSFIAEMDDQLGHDHEDHEPREGETITLTLPAMASVLCTVAHRMGADLQHGGQDEMLLKAMIEAMAEVGHGSHSGAIDVPDLEAVASHMNGEECDEITNRDAGHSDHEGMDDDHHEPADKWPGDGEKSHTGKTKVMDGMHESYGDFYGVEDIIAETRLTDEEELRLVKKRAGLRYW